ncbi:UNVERIFIED_CONTAM: hypothetical protein Scaly_1798100 [Sesamum calycinum]|uniref:DUF1446 domain-containing protein n=1 Tax=Sesamum calycinum TaxID=2727403 RepID=A0AAW2NX91_9LAMI
MEESGSGTPETHDCVIKLRLDPQRRKDRVVIGCGAGFGGDRPIAALKLLQRVKELDLVLECLAERTLAERYTAMKFGGKGYDPRISEWMQLLLPLAVERGVRIITNMGAKSPYGAQEEVLQIASKLGININVGLAYQSSVSEIGLDNQLKYVDGDVSVYLGAAPIVECLERYTPDVIITSRVADASLFLGPMVFELGWNWDELQLLAQGSLAGHLLECGCQLTGGYYMHPAKAESTGGVLDFSTCAQQLLYEVGDPSAYITPDVIVDVRMSHFNHYQTAKFSVVEQSLLLNLYLKNYCCWGQRTVDGKVGEKSPMEVMNLFNVLKLLNFCWIQGHDTIFHGHQVRAWMDESYPGISNHIISYIIGLDSVKATCISEIMLKPSEDVRLRMDGLFEKEEHAVQFTKEFTALYTNGPAGGGGISTGCKKEIFLEKGLVGREYVSWQISVARNNIISPADKSASHLVTKQNYAWLESDSTPVPRETVYSASQKIAQETRLSAALAGQRIPLYDVAHSRAGDKGNDLNFSIIPHYPLISRGLRRL